MFSVLCTAQCAVISLIVQQHIVTIGLQRCCREGGLEGRDIATMVTILLREVEQEVNEEAGEDGEREDG